jgi:hypothetical protein
MPKDLSVAPKRRTAKLSVIGRRVKQTGMMRIHGAVDPWPSGTDWAAAAIDARQDEIESFLGLSFELVEEQGLGRYCTIRGILDEAEPRLAFELYMQQGASTAFLHLDYNQASEATARHVLATLGIPSDRVELNANWPEEPTPVRDVPRKE